MNLAGIISISGKPGLSKIVSQTRTGLIVESLIDGKRTPVHGAERVSSLEDINIYTYKEDILLKDVFQKIFDASKGKAILSHKSSEVELSAYLKEVLPNYDEERVYRSDIKKLIQWYNLLQSKDLLKQDEDKATTKKEPKAATKETSKAKQKPKVPKAAKAASSAAKGKKAAPKGAAKGR
tara:strand:+ start:2855 stop:3394 length:540 start_codon:yes stop_codon:yes gene_type:complete